MNEIRIGNTLLRLKKIYDEQIKAGSLTLANSMISDELSADEMEFTVISGEEDALFDSNLERLKDSNGEYLLAAGSFGTPLDLTDTPYGTRISFLRREMDYSLPIPAEVEVFVTTMYIKEVKQLNKGIWNIKAQSAIGLLINQQHNGGIYSGDTDTVKSVIDDIMSGVPGIHYNVAVSIRNDPVSGWLPVASCRDNLQQLCFAMGISVIKTGNGILNFKYNEPDTPVRSILNDEIYLGATRNSPSPVSSVTVYEHSYYPVTTATRKTVFDNVGGVAAVDQKIIFENPIIVSTLVPAVGDTSGTLIVTEAGANYAIVSGTGTLTGVEYSHSYKVLSETVSDTSNAEGKEIVYKDATLINPLNSTNCLKRIAAYYSLAGENQVDFVAQALPHVDKPGDLVAYPDPYTSDMVSGLIKSMNVTISGIMKSQSTLTANWLPRYLGNTFSQVEEIYSGVTWTPDFTGDVRIVLGGSGNGGNKGEDGENGESGNIFNVAFGKAGKSGKGGLGGAPGKVNVIETSVVAGTPYNISLGTPGTAGTQGSETGGAGNPTTITINGTTYSSEDGAIPGNGFADVLTGKLYAISGDNGTDAAESGDGNAPGGNVTVDDVTYIGGAAGAIFTHFMGRCYGGGGSGAVYGKNGIAGADGRDASSGGQSHAVPGEGANGVSPDVPSKTVPYGGGGHGGHGASGGGGGSVGQDSYDGDWRASAGGLGGIGSDGLAGGGGFILVYH